MRARAAGQAQRCRVGDLRGASWESRTWSEGGGDIHGRRRRKRILVKTRTGHWLPALAGIGIIRNNCKSPKSRPHPDHLYRIPGRQEPSIIMCLFFFCFLGPHWRHVQVPRLGVETEL